MSAGDCACWPKNNSTATRKPMCPHCACPIAYQAHRPSGQLRFRKACRKDFSLTSGALFAFHKLPLQTYLAEVAIFWIPRKPVAVPGCFTGGLRREVEMAGQPGFFDIDERYQTLSAVGDPLQRFAVAVNFESFRPVLDAALARSDRSRDGRPQRG